MSEAQARLARRIHLGDELLAVVRVMKAYAASVVGPYRDAVASLQGYAEAIAQGLSLCLQQEPGRWEASSPTPTRGATAAIAFGSDLGLVGTFNDLLAEALKAFLADSPGVVVWVVGERLHDRLQGSGLVVRPSRRVPESVDGITPLIGELLGDLEQDPAGPFSRIALAHHRPVSMTRYEPRVEPLLPLDPEWLKALRSTAWPTRQVPEVPLGTRRTWRALVREHLFVSLFKACAESVMSENTSRLVAMMQAERHVHDQLEALRIERQQLRQQEVSDELYDLMAAVEALGSGASDGPKRPGG